VALSRNVRHLRQGQLPLRPRELHKSLYLVQSQAEASARSVSQKPGQQRVRQAVNDYRLMQELIEEVSEWEWKRLQEKKR